MKPLSVFAVGTEVVIGTDAAITAVVTAVSIRDRVQYECSWWDGRSRHSAWLSDCEVFSGKRCGLSRTKGARVRIGFVTVSPHPPTLSTGELGEIE